MCKSLINVKPIAARPAYDARKIRALEIHAKKFLNEKRMKTKLLVLITFVIFNTYFNWNESWFSYQLWIYM